MDRSLVIMDLKDRLRALSLRIVVAYGGERRRIDDVIDTNDRLGKVLRPLQTRLIGVEADK